MSDETDEPIIIFERALQADEFETLQTLAKTGVRFKLKTLIGSFVGMKFSLEKFKEVVQYIVPLIKLNSPYEKLFDSYKNVYKSYNDGNCGNSDIHGIGDLIWEIINFVISQTRTNQDDFELLQQAGKAIYDSIYIFEYDQGRMLFRFIELGISLYQVYPNRRWDDILRNIRGPYEDRVSLYRYPIFYFFSLFGMSDVLKLEKQVKIDYTFEVDGKNYYNAVFTGDGFERISGAYIYFLRRRGVLPTRVFGDLVCNFVYMPEMERIYINDNIIYYINIFRKFGAPIYDKRTIDDLNRYCDYAINSIRLLRCAVTRLLIYENLCKKYSIASLSMLSVGVINIHNINVNKLPFVLTSCPSVNLSELITDDMLYQRIQSMIQN